MRESQKTPGAHPREMPRGWTVRALRAGLADALHEIEQLAAGVVHLDRETVHLTREIVVGPDGGDRDQQAESGGDEGLGDAARDGADTAGTGQRHAGESVD